MSSCSSVLCAKKLIHSPHYMPNPLFITLLVKKIDIFTLKVYISYFYGFLTYGFITMASVQWFSMEDISQYLCCFRVGTQRNEECLCSIKQIPTHRIWDNKGEDDFSAGTSQSRTWHRSHKCIYVLWEYKCVLGALLVSHSNRGCAQLHNWNGGLWKSHKYVLCQIVFVSSWHGITTVFSTGL